MAETHAAISAALSAALSGTPLPGQTTPPQTAATPAATPRQPGASQAQQQAAAGQQLSFRAGPAVGSPTSPGEALLGAAPGLPRQSSAPDALQPASR